MVTHLGGSAIFPAEEACHGLVSLHVSVEDGVMAHCVEGVRDIDGNDGVLLAKSNICNTGIEFDSAAKTASGLDGVESRSDGFASDVGCRSPKVSVNCALDADGTVLVVVLKHHVETS